MMKIGIFGNTNNYPYVLALGLRALGVEVALVVNRTEALHRPEGLDPSLRNKYPPWIMDATHICEQDFVSMSLRALPIINFLWHASSAVILNDLGPSLYGYVERPAISLLTGFDLTYYADPATLGVQQAKWDPEFLRSPAGRVNRAIWAAFVHRQRSGILASEAVSFAPQGVLPDGDLLLEQIGVSPNRRFFVWMANTKVAPARRAGGTRRLRILNGARVTWRTPLPGGFSRQDEKGTPVLLEGFAEFVRAGGDGELRMFEKGLHVEEAKALARTLGIAERITWLSEMPLAQFYDEIRQADVVCDQFGTSFPGMVATDALAMGTPVVANFRLDTLGRMFPGTWPVCDARTPQDVATYLLRLTAPDVRQDLGAAAREFAMRYLSPEANAVRCLERLNLRREPTV